MHQEFLSGFAAKNSMKDPPLQAGMHRQVMHTQTLPNTYRHCEKAWPTWQSVSLCCLEKNADCHSLFANWLRNDAEKEKAPGISGGWIL